MKQTHLLLLLGILLFLCYCNREKIEAFGNQLIVPQFEFAILTPNQDPMSGYFQEEICRDDPKWKKGDKKCIDYSMDRNSCLDQGEDGVSANEACPVSCDNCPSSVKIKRRLPSPVEDIEEPEYSVFEGGMGLQGGEIGSVDYRDIYERLDEINDQLDIYTAMTTDTAASSTDPGEELEIQLARYGIDASVPTSCYKAEEPEGGEAGELPEATDTTVFSEEADCIEGGGVWGSMLTHMMTQATQDPIQRLPYACFNNVDCMAKWRRLYDSDGDGVVSPDEFEKGAYKRAEVLETCGEASENENPCVDSTDAVTGGGSAKAYEIDPRKKDIPCLSKACNFDAGPDHRTCCMRKTDSDWFSLESELTNRQQTHCEVFQDALQSGHYISCS